MEPSTHREIERKLRVDDWFVMPDLLADPGLSRVDRRAPFEMAATYYDTEDLVLFRWGITLRSREGGLDSGWHAKLPVAGFDPGVRDEIRMPLTEQLPPALAEILFPLLRGRPLLPVAAVRTMRTPMLAIGPDGRPLVELVSDAVTATDSAGRTIQYREVEVECIEAEAEPLMNRVVERLIDAGAEPTQMSKAAEVLGRRARIAPEIPQITASGPDGLAVDAVRSALGAEAQSLLFADMGVRRDLPDGVHRLRVAARRLRSLLRTFAPLLEPSWVEFMSEELRWLGAELAPLRDGEVVAQLIEQDAARIPGSEEAVAFVRNRLAVAGQMAKSGATAAMRSDRYRMLLDELVRASTDPPVSREAFRPCRHTLPGLLSDQWSALRAAVKDLDPGTPDAQDWHRVRVKAKTLRYAAQALAPTLGSGAVRLGRRLRPIVDTLGEAQDAEIAITVLRECAASGLEHGFSLGMLARVQAERGTRAREGFLEAWPRAKRAARRLQESE